MERLQLEYAKIDASGVAVDMEEGHIESRVSKNQALELLAAWKKILIEYKNEGGDVDALFDAGSGNSESLLGSEKQPNPELEGLKDKLFIATGQDQIDTWEAFHHYKLDDRLSADDVKTYNQA